MTDRVKKLKEALRTDKYPICTEKCNLVWNSYLKNDAQPWVIKRAMATADYLDNKTIFIEDNELLVGNYACRPLGMEARTDMPTWPDEDLDGLCEGNLTISDDDRAILRSWDWWWDHKGRTKDEQQGMFYDDPRLWNFISRGFLCPPWKDRVKGRGQGGAGQGWGIGIGVGTLIAPDYEAILKHGFRYYIEECEKELKELRYYNQDDVYKGQYLRAALIALPAVIRIANRFSTLAADMAARETDETRRAELLEISETCAWVPENPPRTFREALQSFFFYFLIVMSGTTPGRRFDQFMYPYYKADIDAGRITDGEVLELLECLRIKLMQYNSVVGGAAQREKWSGMSRWHNFIIGGCDEDGNDVTNELSYLLLEAAKDTMTPQHTLTIRVNKDTPDKLIQKGLEVVRLGLGMPAFISEDSYIDFILKTNPELGIREARRFVCAGPLDLHLPGNSINNSMGMFITPTVIELAIFNGMSPSTGLRYGPETGSLDQFQTYEDFYQAFLTQFSTIMGLICEEHNILQIVSRDSYPDVLTSIFAKDGIKAGKDMLNREMGLQNSSAINLVGIIDTTNCLAAIKQLVFEQKAVSPEAMMDALKKNWDGYEELRQMCVQAPKFGNNDDYVDLIAQRLYDDAARLAHSYTNTWGKPMVISGISITAHAPGGAYTGATPNGRFAGEAFADGSVSPSQGTDLNGPLAVFQSGMKLNQGQFMATLLNMKFHPNSLKTDADLAKLGAAIRTYLTHGGKHVQFNVVDCKTLLEAKKNREKYRDLVVRVAGYSSYFTVLTEKVQDEVIKRTEHAL